MFTGLIEEVGNVVTVRATDRGTQLQIAASRLAKKTRSGENIATEGFGKSRACSCCKRALWWTFHSRAHRLCLADHRLPEERRRFSIGNRVTIGVRPLCRVQGLHCGEWNQSDGRRNSPEKFRRVDYSLYENAHQSGPGKSRRPDESRVRYSRQVR